MANPQFWGRYLLAAKSRAETPSRILANFAARYRMAKSLESIVLTGYSAEARRGYLVAMKVALAYSALETLERGIDRFSPNKRTPIFFPRLGTQVSEGKLDDLLSSLIEAAEPRFRTSFAKRLDVMKTSTDPVNLRPLVEGLRNSMFHGKFTPTSSGLAKSKRNSDLLESLAEEILHTSDRLFEEWLGSRH